MKIKIQETSCLCPICGKSRKKTTKKRKTKILRRYNMQFARSRAKDLLVESIHLYIRESRVKI